MNFKFPRLLAMLSAMLIIGTFSNCDKEDDDSNIHYFEPTADVQAKLQETLITMEDGDIIHLRPGLTILPQLFR